MLGFYNYTVWLTYLGLISATLGIAYASNGNPFVALFCLIICGLLDSFDGTVARTKKDRTEEQKKFGIQIDSLTDVVSFGVLPAMIGYSLGLTKWYFLVGLAFYVLAAMIRLAHFNVSEEERQQVETTKRKFYLGLPVPNIVLIAPTVCVFAKEVKGALPYIYFSALLFVAVLFLSKFKLPKVGMKGIIILTLLGTIILVLLFIRRSTLA